MTILFIKTFMEFRAKVAARLNALKAAKQENTQEYAQLVLMFTRLNQMRDYIISGDWARKSVREKYVFWIRNNFDYLLTANKYKTSDKSMRVLVSRADATLAKLMSKPLEQIRNGNVNDGWIEFGINANLLDLHELFGRPVLMVVPRPADLAMCFSLEDCKDEIKFLRAHNSYEVRREMEQLDQQKIAYLLALGSVNDPAYHDERKRLIRALLHINHNEK